MNGDFDLIRFLFSIFGQDRLWIGVIIITSFGLIIRYISFRLSSIKPMVKVEIKSDDGTVKSFKIHSNLNKVDILNLVEKISNDFSNNQINSYDEFLAVGNVSENQRELKALIVDDDTDTRGVVNNTLMTLGYEVKEAKDGVEALDMLSQGPYNLIVTDIKMPRMDGVSLTQAIRRDYGNVYVLLITGHGTPNEAAQQTTKAGANDYLMKPFDVSDLIKHIRSALPPTAASH